MPCCSRRCAKGDEREGPIVRLGTFRCAASACRCVLPLWIIGSTAWRLKSSPYLRAILLFFTVGLIYFEFPCPPNRRRFNLRGHFSRAEADEFKALDDPSLSETDALAGISQAQVGSPLIKAELPTKSARLPSWALSWNDLPQRSGRIKGLGQQGSFP